MSDTPAQRLLLVHAHPDDESIGQGATMAKYVAEGRGVTLVTCTAGEMGEILVPELEHLAADRDDKLGEHRRGELADAMAVLGVTDHRFLGGFGRFRDSGMKWHADGYAVAADDLHDNAFWRADLTEAADLLVEIIREVRPQVLVTYDQFGGYGHPDHIQAHRVATYGAALAAVPSYRTDLGESWDVPKIYWGAMSESRMRAGLRALRAAGDTTSFEGMDPDGPLPHFVTPDDNLAAMVDAEDHVDKKMAALAAHRTQITMDGPFFALSNNVGSHAWGAEFYRIAKGEQGPLGDDGLETDLFAGIDKLNRALALRLVRALALVLLGVAVGALAILVHGRPVGLALGLVTSAATAWALPGGWSLRFSFAAGWVAVLGYVLVPRAGGGYLIGSDTPGYLLLGFGLALMLFGIVTVRPLRPPTDPGDPAAP